jgi:hypothetical protein
MFHSRILLLFSSPSLEAGSIQAMSFFWIWQSVNKPSVDCSIAKKSTHTGLHYKKFYGRKIFIIVII